MEDIRLRRHCDEGVCKAMHFQRELEQQDAEIAELVKLTDEVVFGTEQEMGLLDCSDGYYKTSTWDSVKKLRELISKHKKGE